MCLTLGVHTRGGLLPFVVLQCGARRTHTMFSFLIQVIDHAYVLRFKPALPKLEQTYYTKLVVLVHRVIELTNAGTLSLKTQGPKKTNIVTDLSDVRKKTVSTYRDSSSSNLTQLRCVPIKEWEETNQNDAKKSGEATGMEFHLGRWQEVVYLNMQEGNSFVKD
jgi:hypothetical protein